MLKSHQARVIRSSASRHHSYPHISHHSGTFKYLHTILHKCASCKFESTIGMIYRSRLSRCVLAVRIHLKMRIISNSINYVNAQSTRSRGMWRLCVHFNSSTTACKWTRRWCTINNINMYMFSTRVYYTIYHNIATFYLWIIYGCHKITIKQYFKYKWRTFI